MNRPSPSWKQDVLRFYRNSDDPSTIRRMIQAYRAPGIHAVLVYRFAQWWTRSNPIVRLLFAPLALYLQHRIRAKWGIEISPWAEIGSGFVIVHHGGVFIPSDLVAGANLTIHHDVTFGVAFGKTNGSPSMGDNVTIGPGAVIIGRIRIGDNVRIGPNAVVTKDIPDNSVVQVESSRIIQFPKGFGASRSA